MDLTSVPYEEERMEATHWWGAHPHGFWIIPLVFMIVMCVLAGLMARRACGWRCGVARIGPRQCSWPDSRFFAHRLPETPRQTLDRRYAGGEITREQYAQVKRELEGEHDAAEQP
jgi:putative membrane protein